MKLLTEIFKRLMMIFVQTAYMIYEIVRSIVLWVANICDVIACGEPDGLSEQTKKVFNDLFSFIFQIDKSNSK